MLAICLDIDNVIAGTDEVIRSLISRHTDGAVALRYEDIVCFDYCRCQDSNGRRISQEDWKAVHEEFTRNHLLSVAPSDGIVDQLQRLVPHFDLHLATSRLEGAEQDTKAWLRDHEIPFNSLQFVKHGEKHLTREYDFFAAIDDDREQALAFSEADVRTYLLAHPWNEISSHSRVKRLPEFRKIVDDLLGVMN